MRVDDAEKRKEILEKTSDFLLPINMSTDSNYLFAFDGWVSRIYGRGLRGEQGIKELEAANFIDCGTNTELFLTLASMNSDTDKGQWFVSHGVKLFDKLKGTVETSTGRKSIIAGEWFKPLVENIKFKWLGNPEFHRAAAAEIIEHFKSKTK